MLTKLQSKIFINQFLDYFEEYVLTAEFTDNGKMIVFSNPYLEFDTLIIYICEHIFDILYFTDPIQIIIYPFGTNDHLLITIN
jgi:hypothetical protein